MNALAHIYDGGSPPARDGKLRRNTLLGMALHTGASVWWAAFYELGLALQARPRRWRSAAALAAIAYVVDYHVVGKRFQPGFEKHLSPVGLLGVYAALAAGYAASGKRRALVREG